MCRHLEVKGVPGGFSASRLPLSLLQVPGLHEQRQRQFDGLAVGPSPSGSVGVKGDEGVCQTHFPDDAESQFSGYHVRTTDAANSAGVGLKVLAPCFSGIERLQRDGFGFLYVRRYSGLGNAFGVLAFSRSPPAVCDTRTITCINQ